MVDPIVLPGQHHLVGHRIAQLTGADRSAARGRAAAWASALRVQSGQDGQSQRQPGGLFLA